MKTTVRRSATIVCFVTLLNLTGFFVPQIAHLQRFVNLLVVVPRRKTMA
ncbi:MAG: hypothetical protein ACFCD0_26305 [Gemmataceae bacterium]